MSRAKCNGRRAECSITICKIANLSGRHHIVGVSALSAEFELTHTQESFAQNKTALSFVDELSPKRFSNQPSKVEPGLCLDLDPDDSPSAAVCARRLHLFKEHIHVCLRKEECRHGPAAGIRTPGHGLACMCRRNPAVHHYPGGPLQDGASAGAVPSAAGCTWHMANLRVPRAASPVLLLARRPRWYRPAGCGIVFP